MNHYNQVAYENSSYSPSTGIQFPIILVIVFQLIGIVPAHAQYQIDSVVHILGDKVNKISQQYDQSSNTVLRTYISTDPTTNVQLEGQRDFGRFDSDDKLMLRTISQWDAETNTWKNEEHTEIKYDEKGRAIIIQESRENKWEGLVQELDSVVYAKDSIETFSFVGSELLRKKVAYLDKHDNAYLSINYQWNTESQIWDPLVKTNIEHQKRGVLKESSTYLWTEGEWMPSEKTSYVFANNGEKSTGSISYSGNGQEWQPVSKIAEEYFENQRMKTDTTYQWSVEENRWNPEIVIRVSYLNEQDEETQGLIFKVNTERNAQELLFEALSSYNDEGKLLFYQQIYYEESQPISGYQRKYLIDESGNITKYIMLELDTNANQWIEIVETDFTYHLDIPASIKEDTVISGISDLGIYPLNDHSTNAISEVKEYHFENGVKSLHEHILYYYSPINLQR